MSNQAAHLNSVYEEAFRHYDPSRPAPPLTVTFYPYIGINHTIRIRGGAVFVRIGEICRDMPLSGQRGLAFILVGKLFRRKIPREMNDAYNAFIKSDDIRERASDHKRNRGRKVVTTSKGEIYDLDEVFAALNERYFGGWIRKPTLTWSAQKTYRILGHHDATHDHITISKSLDSKKVPQFIVEYVVFHEMLHIAHPAREVNGRRYHHTPEFKKDERRFTHYAEAERWIEDNVGKLRRAAKRRG